MRRLDLGVAGICLAAWLLATANLWIPALRELGGLPGSSLFPWAVAVGWLAGNLYVRGTRDHPELSRLLLPVYVGGPPGLIWLYWSLMALSDRRENPLAPLLALAVFAVFFLVPVTLRNFPRRR